MIKLPLNRVHTDVDEGLPSVRQVGVQCSVHGHLGEEPHDTLLISTLDNLLQTGRGWNTQGVHTNTSFSLGYFICKVFGPNL